MRSGAVREERESEPQRGWRALWREPWWLPRVTGLRAGLRALSPGSGRLQGRLPTALRMEKLRPGEGARGCTTPEVVACGGGFTHNHSLILSFLYSKSILGSSVFSIFTTYATSAYYLYSCLLNLFSKLSHLFSFKHAFTFYRETLLHCV